MNINTIKLRHTNPSLGPHEKITTVTLTISKVNMQTLENFMKTAMVNNTVTMSAYLEAVLSNDEKVLDRIGENAPKAPLSSGAKISTLVFELDNKQSVKLYDVYRQFSLTNFYPDFTKYMVDNGTIDTVEPGSTGSLFYENEEKKPPKPNRK